MSDPLVIYKDRTNLIPVVIKTLDVTNDTITAEIREGKTSDSVLIATFQVDFVEYNTDDPEATFSRLLLTIDDSDLTDITQTHGFMDFKRVSAGEPLPLIKAPHRVKFQGSVTA